MEPQADSNQHECHASRHGDWIIYKCPRCDYEMRENWRTGKMVVRNVKTDIHHFGNYFPMEYLEAFVHHN